MQITNTSIKHKRYSTYGWSVKDDQGNYKNTLAQGEIGILLGSRNNQGGIDIVDVANSGKILNAVLEVRVGEYDGQYFFDSLLIGKEGDTDLSIRQVTELPEYGDTHHLYICKGIAYYWDNDKNEMLPLSGSSFTQSQIEDIVDNRINNIGIIDGNKK